MSADDVSTTTEGKLAMKKSSKPIMEKKRRARFNSSVAQLKSLLADTIKSEGTRYNKMDKADILELTVKHLKGVQGQNTGFTRQETPAKISRFRMGFSECINEVSLFLNDLDPNKADLRASLMEHLANCSAGYLPDGTNSIDNQHVLLSTTHAEPTISRDQNACLNLSTKFQELGSGNITSSGTYGNTTCKRLLLNTQDPKDSNETRSKTMTDEPVVSCIENSREASKNMTSVQTPEKTEQDRLLLAEKASVQSLGEKFNQPDSINISNTLAMKGLQYNLAREKQKEILSKEHPNMSSSKFDFASNHIPVSDSAVVKDHASLQSKSGVNARTESQLSNDICQITTLNNCLTTSSQSTSILSTPLYAVHLTQLSSGPIALIVPANIVTPTVSLDLTGTNSQSPLVSTISSSMSCMQPSQPEMITLSPSKSNESLTTNGHHKHLSYNYSLSDNSKVQVASSFVNVSKLQDDQGLSQISSDSLSVESRCSNQPRTNLVNTLHIETHGLYTSVNDNILPTKLTQPADQSCHVAKTRDIQRDKRYYLSGQTEQRYSLETDKSKAGLRHDLLPTPTRSHTNEPEGTISRTRLYSSAFDGITRNAQCHERSITSSRKNSTSPIDLSSQSQRILTSVSSTDRDDIPRSRDHIHVAAEEANNNDDNVWRPLLLFSI